MALVKPPIPVGYCKATAYGLFGPTFWNNVFYFAVNPTTSTAPADILADIGLNVINFYRAMSFGRFTSAWQVSGTKIVWRDASDSVRRATVADAHPGTGGAGAQDAQVAYLINFNSTDDRRGGKPRKYVTGVPDSVVADSATLNSADVSAISTGVNAWIASLLTGGVSVHGTALELVDMSFRNGKTWRDAAHVFPIDGGSCSTVVATQRRRIDRLRGR